MKTDGEFFLSKFYEKFKEINCYKHVLSKNEQKLDLSRNLIEVLSRVEICP